MFKESFVAQRHPETSSRRPDKTVEPNEGSQPAGSDADGDPIPSQPGPDEQSGSNGRRAVGEGQPAGKDTGQGRYGQSGFGGGDQPPTQTRYQDSAKEGDDKSKHESNRGSGRADREPAPKP
jgi:hypothetical protein